jgi:hypothetical protein
MPRDIAKVKVQDPDGESWHAEASRRWQAAERRTPEEPFAVYEPVPLPDFSAGRSASVTRDLLGRFLHDRESGILHDCYAAVPGCAVDEIRNGTFYHFWSEVPEGADPCDLCLP